MLHLQLVPKLWSVVLWLWLTPTATTTKARMRVGGGRVVVHSSSSSSSSTPAENLPRTFEQEVQAWLEGDGDGDIAVCPVGDGDQQKYLTRQSRPTTPTPTTSLGYNDNATHLLALTRSNGNSNSSSSSSSNIATDASIWLHLLPTPTGLHECPPPRLLHAWTDALRLARQQHSNKGHNARRNVGMPTKIIHLHQDVWDNPRTRPIVKSRLLAQLGIVRQRVFGRRTTVRRLHDKRRVKEFCQRHHLWGATASYKYAFGLLLPGRGGTAADASDGGGTLAHGDDDDDAELLAVATFGARRRVWRQGHPYRSHELLRYCTRRHVTIVGGLSKLIRAFINDPTARPDDIVTLVDRNWGDGAGWDSVGFTSVGVLDPLVMAVPLAFHSVTGPQRKALVGHSPLQHENLTLWSALEASASAESAKQALLGHGYAPVYDAGVERLVCFPHHNRDNTDHDKSLLDAQSSVSFTCRQTEKDRIRAIWYDSYPSYPPTYYSSCSGVAALLAEARESKSQQLHNR